MSVEAIHPSGLKAVPGREESLPLYHLPAWAERHPGIRIVQMGAEADSNPGLAIQVEASRALPGHRLWRIARFGHGWPRETWEQTVDALATMARSDGRVLRLNLEIFLRSDHEAMRQCLRKNGFVSTEARSYRHTLTLPLDAPVDDLLATRKSLRKRLREAEKAGVVVRQLTDAVYADRIAELQRIAMERSGGSFRIPDWAAMLGMSAEHPGLSRIVGLFPSSETSAPADLLGFAWGCMHGDHAEYRAAGTADLPPALRNVSISHPLLWDLMLWSRENGATWFDMGGVTLQSGSDDPLAGISAAKRVFSETVEEVGEEWMLEPHPWRSRAARRISALSGTLRRLVTPGQRKSR